MEIIPAIDIIEGKCVRLRKGDFSAKTIYHDDPVEMAVIFHDHGLGRLHLVDLDGAKVGKVIHYRILEKIFSKTGMIIDFGGGLKTNMDLEIAFQSGAAMITAGSIAVKDPGSVVRWLEKYGPDKIILGADVNNGRIAVNAWQTETKQEIFSFIDAYQKCGIRKVICTEISRDGMMQGPAVDLYGQIRDRWKDLFLVASGGVSVPSDLDELVKTGLNGAIIGKALYEQTITFKDLQKFIK